MFALQHSKQEIEEKLEGWKWKRNIEGEARKVREDFGMHEWKMISLGAKSGINESFEFREKDIEFFWVRGIAITIEIEIEEDLTFW